MSEYKYGGTEEQVIRDRKGMSSEEIAEMYNKWVKQGTYESNTMSLHYTGHVVTAKAICEIYQTNRENIQILDFAAGTGLLSRELRKHGFQNIDGVDPSLTSKNYAMKENLYRRYIVDFVGEHQLDLQTDSYDCIASSGGFAAGLMPCAALKEMIRVTKPDGIVCFSVPDYIFTLCDEYRDTFQPLIDSYVTQAVWEKISVTHISSYFDNKPGTVYTFRTRKSVV